MGPLGIDRGLLEALQSKVVLPGGLRAAAVVCLWRAAGYEHHIRTGTSNSTADAAQAGNLGSRGDKAGLGGGEPEGLREGVSEAGGVHLMPGFQLPVRKKIRSVPRPSPEAQPCRYSIQEVLADEGLASQLASLGPQLPRLVYREMKWRGAELLQVVFSAAGRFDLPGLGRCCHAKSVIHWIAWLGCCCPAPSVVSVPAWQRSMQGARGSGRTGTVWKWKHQELQMMYGNTSLPPSGEHHLPPPVAGHQCP
eukprot:scaffold41629_cov20-Tisochrysis_lutea.AAC.1